MAACAGAPRQLLAPVLTGSAAGTVLAGGHPRLAVRTRPWRPAPGHPAGHGPGRAPACWEQLQGFRLGGQQPGLLENEAGGVAAGGQVPQEHLGHELGAFGRADRQRESQQRGLAVAVPAAQSLFGGDLLEHRLGSLPPGNRPARDRPDRVRGQSHGNHEQRDLPPRARLQHRGPMLGARALLLESEVPYLAVPRAGAAGPAQLAGGVRAVVIDADRQLEITRRCPLDPQGPLGVVQQSDRLQARAAQTVGVQQPLVPAPRTRSPLAVVLSPGPAPGAGPL